jgi:RNA recognition motif-containing protein
MMVSAQSLKKSFMELLSQLKQKLVLSQQRFFFGFVEMSACDADNAVNQLNDSEFQQRTLKVREAKERPEKTDNDE